MANICWINVNQRIPGHIYDPLRRRWCSRPGWNQTRQQEAGGNSARRLAQTDLRVFLQIGISTHPPTSKNSAPFTSVDLCSLGD